MSRRKDITNCFPFASFSIPRQGFSENVIKTLEGRRGPGTRYADCSGHTCGRPIDAIGVGKQSEEFHGRERDAVRVGVQEILILSTTWNRCATDTLFSMIYFVCGSSNCDTVHDWGFYEQ